MPATEAKSNPSLMPKSGGARHLWEVEYHPKAAREIRALHGSIRERIRQAIEQLQEDPWHGKALVGRLAGLRSRRVGDYRVVYLIEEEHHKLFIVHVGPRSGAYPKAQRRRSS